MTITIDIIKTYLKKQNPKRIYNMLHDNDAGDFYACYLREELGHIKIGSMIGIAFADGQSFGLENGTPIQQDCLRLNKNKKVTAKEALKIINDLKLRWRDGF